MKKFLLTSSMLLASMGALAAEQKGQSQEPSWKDVSEYAGHWKGRLICSSTQLHKGIKDMWRRGYDYGHEAIGWDLDFEIEKTGEVVGKMKLYAYMSENKGEIYGTGTFGLKWVEMTTPDAPGKIRALIKFEGKVKKPSRNSDTLKLSSKSIDWYTRFPDKYKVKDAFTGFGAKLEPKGNNRFILTPYLCDSIKEGFSIIKKQN